LNSSINASVGDHIGNGNPPELTIRNLTVKTNRTHGVLLETSNVDIRNCVFNRKSVPTILFQTSLFLNEGSTARINYLYINCNEGIGEDHGVINITLTETEL